MMNTNYNIPSKTSFAARLDLRAAEGMVKDGEIEILKDIASRIGKATDSIRVDIGETHRWDVGDNRSGDVLDGYPMKVITVIDGDIKESNLDSSMSCFSDSSLPKPFQKLEPFFKRLEQITSPEFRQGVLSKIESLKTELANLANGKKAIEPDYEIKKQAFDEIAATRRSIIAKEKSLENEIENFQKKLEI